MKSKPEEAKCSHCGNPVGQIGTAYTHDETGMVHTYCHARANPPKVALTIQDVMDSADDPILAHQIIVRHLSGSSLQMVIVKEYNDMMAEIYRERIRK